MRITSKGQVTPPRAACALRAGPGAEVEVVDGENGALVRPLGLRGGRGAELVARLRDRADGGLSAEAVLHLTRGEHE